MSFSESKLVGLLTKANKAYRSGNPIMSDSEYDALEERLRRLNPNNSYLSDTGIEPVDTTRKSELPVPMHSFEKVYCDTNKGDQLTPFFNSTNNNVLVWSLKYDGAALLIEYKDGNLVQAYTKGRHSIGQKALYHARAISTIPKNISVKDHIFVKAELLIPNSIFEKKYSVQYKNPRNLVAGFLNSKEVSPIANDITAIAHTLINKNEKYHKDLEWDELKKLGFQVVSGGILYKEKRNTATIERTLTRAKEMIDFLIDGVVIEQASSNLRTEYHPNGNPKFGVAFKVQLDANVVETTVEMIEWNIGKSGALIPLVHYTPIELLGTTCKKASGYNYKYIQENQLGEGSRIKIQKSGDIIPSITEVLSQAHNFSVPKRCPSCNSILIKEDVHLMCNNDLCTDKIIKQTVSFFTTIGVENFKEGLIKRIIEESKCNGFTDIIKMNSWDFTRYGLGESQSRTITTDIKNKLRSVGAAKLLHATGFFTSKLGSTKLQWILDKYGVDLYSLLSLKKERIIREVQGIEETTAEAFVKGITLFNEWFSSNKMTKYITIETPVKISNGKFSGETIVFTGFRDKNLEEFLVKNGAIVSNSLSKKTTILLVKEAGSNSSKEVKAKELGIKIITVKELLK